MNKQELSERDICTKYILPALERAGWDRTLQMREEFEISKGRITVRGKLVSRGQPRRADIALCYKPNIPIAVIEAKSNLRSLGAGMQQALNYAETLQVPFAFSSNGDGFVFHDRTGQAERTETNLGLNDFPSPEELWTRYRRWKGLDEEAEKIVLQDFHDDGGGKTPRYYQLNAINATIEAIAKGQDRILLVMATGTGKTYTAFQIIWRLWKAGQKKRILFLADRNVLVDQTMVNDFRPFAGAMAKLSTKSKTIERADGNEVNLPLAVDRQRRIDTAYEIYLGLYQAITGPEDHQKLFRELSPDFFDLICHVAFDAKPLTRRERADNVKKRDVFNRYGEQARAVLDTLLEKYADEGVLNLDDTNVLKIPPLDQLGTPVELVRAFVGKPGFEQAVHDLQNELYQPISQETA